MATKETEKAVGKFILMVLSQEVINFEVLQKHIKPKDKEKQFISKEKLEIFKDTGEGLSYSELDHLRKILYIYIYPLLDCMVVLRSIEAVSDFTHKYKKDGGDN
jgi:hypothetical protein